MAWRWLVVLGCAACGEDGGEAPPAMMSAPVEPAPLGDLVWRRCGALQCAEVMVPLDPASPEGEQIPIALNRWAADPAGPNYGVLLFNPGGPGSSGKRFVEALEPLSALPFDLIGFDPRGVGDSLGVDCPLENAALRFAAEGVPGTIELLREQGQRCRERVGPLFDHLGTNTVVGDIEHIRRALGVEQISFYGISYGTRLGAGYAQRYPERVRALVLDSPMPPTADYPAFIAAQFDATLAAHQALIADCEQGQLSCPADAAAQFDRALRAYTRAGLRTNLISLWALQLASPPGREFLAMFLSAAASLTDDELDAALLEAMMGTAPVTMLTLPDVAAATNLTVNCSDSSVEPPAESDAVDLMAAYAQRSEVFGPLALPAITCAGWPAARDPVSSVSFRLATPPLIIGGVADTLTPLPMAEALQQAIEGAALLVSEHYGHGGLSFGGECVGSAVVRYLLSLELPPAGTVCSAP